MAELSEMIKRVARAIATERNPSFCIDDLAYFGEPMRFDKGYLHLSGGLPLWQFYIRDAFMAVAAMRKPTEEMVAAALSTPELQFVGGEDIEDGWFAMIDAALKETTP